MVSMQLLQLSGQLNAWLHGLGTIDSWNFTKKVESAIMKFFIISIISILVPILLGQQLPTVYEYYEGDGRISGLAAEPDGFK